MGSTNSIGGHGDNAALAWNLQQDKRRSPFCWIIKEKFNIN